MAPRRSGALALACLLLAAAFGGPVSAQDAAPAADYPSIIDAATALNLTTLLAVAQGTALQSSLESFDFQGIVLAPTDAAFSALNDTLVTAYNLTLGDLPPAIVEQILSYHVIAANESFPSIDNTTRSTYATLLDGQLSAEEVIGSIATIPFAADDAPGRTYVGGVPNGALVSPDVSATAAQARVYIIDTVLMPAFASVPDLNITYPLSVASLANSSADFSVLLQLVGADEEVLGLLSDPTSAYTIFAPNDAAFQNFLESANLTLTDLLPLLGGDVAKRVLKNHVLNYVPTLSSDIPDGADLSLPTASDNVADVLAIKNVGGEITVAGTGNAEPAKVVAADVLAGLSVVHVIDKVLLPEGALGRK